MKKEWKDILKRYHGDMRNTVTYIPLPEDFIRDFQDEVDWVIVSYVQNLSENFIREFQDKVSWIHISHSQQLSEDFIKEFQDKLDWNIIMKQYPRYSFVRNKMMAVL